jgi:hypothetical protein
MISNDEHFFELLPGVGPVTLARLSESPSIADDVYLNVAHLNLDNGPHYISVFGFGAWLRHMTRMRIPATQG